MGLVLSWFVLVPSGPSLGSAAAHDSGLPREEQDPGDGVADRDHEHCALQVSVEPVGEDRDAQGPEASEEVPDAQVDGAGGGAQGLVCDLPDLRNTRESEKESQEQATEGFNERQAQTRSS